MFQEVYSEALACFWTPLAQNLVAPIFGETWAWGFRPRSVSLTGTYILGRPLEYLMFSLLALNGDPIYE